MSKIKKRIGLYDLYRYIVTGKQDRIKGIEYFDCNKEATIVVVQYSGDDLLLNRTKTYIVDGLNKSVEKKGIQKIVKLINKTLGNCEKPGPKCTENYKFMLGDIVYNKETKKRYIVTELKQSYFVGRLIREETGWLLDSYERLDYKSFSKRRSIK